MKSNYLLLVSNGTGGCTTSKWSFVSSDSSATMVSTGEIHETIVLSKHSLRHAVENLRLPSGPLCEFKAMCDCVVAGSCTQRTWRITGAASIFIAIVSIAIQTIQNYS